MLATATFLATLLANVPAGQQNGQQSGEQNGGPWPSASLFTRDVKSVALKGLAGNLVITGRGVALLGGDGRPVIAVAEGQEEEKVKGRVLVVAHGGYLALPNTAEYEGNHLLMTRGVDWLVRGKKMPKIGVHSKGQEEFARAVGGVPVMLGTPAVYTGLDSVVVENGQSDSALKSYLASGGTAVVSGTPWGWAQLNPGKSLRTDYDLQGVTGPFGIWFGSEVVYSPKPITERAERLSAAYHLSVLQSTTDPKALAAGGFDSKPILDGLRVLPLNSPFVKAIEARLGNTPVTSPTEGHPFGPDRPLDRLHLAYGAIIDPNAPGAVDFPGAPPEGAKTVSQRVEIDPKSGWASTGAYAAPNAEITVRVAAESFRAMDGARLQIGTHSDELWHLEEWKRYPEITRSVPIVDGVAKIRSPFGGLVIIDAQKSNSRVGVLIEGAVEAPRFVLGMTTDAEWRRQRTLPGPWAELQGKHLILTVPSQEIRNLEDPATLMRGWDQTLELFADLDGNGIFDRPERIVADRQISAGYMHSGYPIMTWLDAPALAVDHQKLTTVGTWGHWHELGHNRQLPAWTFDGTGEVTNNLFTVYGMVKVAHRPLYERLDQSKKQITAYLAQPDFKVWKSEPFVALTTYIGLVDAFGWPKLQEVFRSYGKNTQLRSEQEKQDQWAIRYSKAVGKNLAPYFRRWGWPLSSKVDEAVGTLPAWNGEAQIARWK